jgi:nicotinamide-nucleotide amidase
MIFNHYSLSRQLGGLLKSHGQRVAVAESCTGGGLAKVMTDVAGSSEWFDRGFVTYSNAAKMDLLQVQSTTLEKFGAVSQEVAREMVRGALKNSNADWALSITGIAGPSGGTPDKPVGLVWFGLVNKNGEYETRKQIYFSGRQNIRESAIHFALSWLVEKSQF